MNMCRSHYTFPRTLKKIRGNIVHYTMFYRWIQNIVKSVTQMLICNNNNNSNNNMLAYMAPVCHKTSEAPDEANFNADGLLTNSTACY